MSEYISIADFAERAGVSKQAVYKRVEKDLNQYFKLLDGKKFLHTNALTLFNSNDSTEAVEQPESSDLKDDMIQQLKLENERLNNQNSQSNDLIKKLQEENSKLTNQLITLSNDFSELAKQSHFLTSQAQSLQGHIQQQTLGKANEELASTGETRVDSVDQQVRKDDKPVEPIRRRGFFARLFG